MKKSRQINLKECYEILQLDKDARLEDVKKAYRKRAFELHPDLNPHTADAGYQFQRLNEAYVALSQVLQTEEATHKTSGQKTAGHDEKAHKGAASGKAGAASAHEKSAGASQKAAEPKTEAQREAERKKKQSASAAYEKEYEKEDVLRDLLNDSFARRVFEDIYSELNKQTQNTSSTTATGQGKPSAASTSHKASSSTSSFFSSTAASGGSTGSGLSSPSVHATRVEVDSGPLPFSGFASKMKGWLLHQIDAKQVVKMSTATLFPGARIRLQIRQGLSEDLKTFEITLPKDFAVGKPMRLRGLGKKVGRWQGDLYITIENI